MLSLSLIISFLVGFSLLNLISFKFSILEKIGLSFLLGIFLQTILMLFLDSLGVALTQGSILIVSFLTIIILNIPAFKNRRNLLEEFRSWHFKIPDLNLVWLLFICILVYLEYMNFTKCMFYPTFDRDSLAGFDTIGWVISQEHTLKGLSIFEGDYIERIHNAGSYITYMPMLQLSYAYVYIFGAATSKIIPALVFLSFLISFYAVTFRFVRHTGAAVITFFVFITPEMLGFSSLSATNVVHAVYASLGIIYTVLWLRDGQKQDCILGAVLLAGNLWVRNEGIVFIGAAVLVVLLHYWKKRTFKSLLIYGLIAIAPLIIWILFMKTFGIYAQSIVITHPFWDPDKAEIIYTYFKSHLMNQQYYGLTFTIFLIAILLNIWFIIKKKDQLDLLLMTILSIVFYMIVLYQINYLWDSINNVLAYSAKRFIFCFIPLVWLYIGSNHWASRLFQVTDNYLSYKRFLPEQNFIGK